MSEADDTIRAWQEWGANLPKLGECKGCGELVRREDDLCFWCEAQAAERADNDAAIETLRVFLLNHAEACARIKHTYHERRACIAIALALLL